MRPHADERNRPLVRQIAEAVAELIHALDALETAEAQRDPQLIFLKVNPVFVALRDQRRFRDLLGRLYRD